MASGAETHVDQSLLTVIAADTVDGLEVRPCNDQQPWNILIY